MAVLVGVIRYSSEQSEPDDNMDIQVDILLRSQKPPELWPESLHKRH